MTHIFASLDADITTRSRSVTKPGLYSILTQADRVESKLLNWRNTDVKIMTTLAPGAKFVEYEMDIHQPIITNEEDVEASQKIFSASINKVHM
ncbi:MAG: hypothetical protein GWP61_24250 [Chloroflexi bacterium]|jgi:glyoxylate utilization-related uncharacterized protein|nr:hypothetical protein [Chloroflexota bacterium]